MFINILEKHSHQVSVWLDVSDQDDAAQGPFILIQLCHWSKNKWSDRGKCVAQEDIKGF